jgi:hypothetical protein
MTVTETEGEDETRQMLPLVTTGTTLVKTVEEEEITIIPEGPCST